MDAIHLPVGLTLPSAFGAPAAPLQAGQVVQALVLELIESDIFRLQLPQATLDVRSSVPLTPGSTITLAVKGSGPSTRLAIYPGASPISSAPAVTSSLIGRTPIGEAVVISRAPAGQGTPAPLQAQSAPVDGRSAAPASPRTLPQAVVLRETPVSVQAAQRPAEAPVRAVTPAEAVTEAIQTAAPRQAGLAQLLADLEQIVRMPDAVRSPIPPAMRQAAINVLSLRVPLDEQLTASDLKQSFARSGVLLETRLAAAQGIPADAGAGHEPVLPASAAPNRATEAAPTFGDSLKTVPASHDDLKSALLVLRQALKVWSAGFPPEAAPGSVRASQPSASQPAMPTPAEASAPASDIEAIRHIASALAGLPEGFPQRAPVSPEQASSLAKSLAAALARRDAPPASAAPPAHAVAPPYRGAPLATQAVAAPSLPPDAEPQAIAHKLIAETDGALARQTLLQVASLPEQPSHPRGDVVPRWNFEVPFATPQGAAIAQFEVSRDGSAANADPRERTWRARFTLDVEPMGPVHAVIALAGARTSVTLWAERAATVARLNEHAMMLGEALRAAELEPADVQFRVGAPPAVRQAGPGRFMDRAS